MNALSTIIMVFAALILTTKSANATLIVLDFDDAVPGTFLTQPLSEDGFTFTVGSGHYDIWSDSDGGNYFTTDGPGWDSGPFAFGHITLARDDGGLFDVESFLVPHGAPGPAYSLSAVGNTGDIFAPSTSGQFFFGDDFHNISALVIAQNSASLLFGFDDLTLRTPMPTPGTFLLFALGLLGLGYNRLLPDIRRS